MALKTDFKDDIFEGNRKYKLSQDGAGNTEIQDVTVYSQEGDLFTAEHINATNEAVNGLSEDMVDLKNLSVMEKHRLPQPSLRNGYLQRQQQHLGRWQPISGRLSWEAVMRCRRMFWQARLSRTMTG